MGTRDPPAALGGERKATSHSLGNRIQNASSSSLEVTERLHYFHARQATQKYTFARESSFGAQDVAVDDPCPASLEQRVSACTDVFEVWNNEARRRRANAAVNFSRNTSHDPRRRSLSSAMSTFSFESSGEGSTSGRQRRASDSFSRSSSASGRSSTLVIRITPSNSYGSLSDLPGADTAPEKECAASSPSSGCVGENDDSDKDFRTLVSYTSTSVGGSSCISDEIPEDFSKATSLQVGIDSSLEKELPFSPLASPDSSFFDGLSNCEDPALRPSSELPSDLTSRPATPKKLKNIMNELRSALRRRYKRG